MIEHAKFTYSSLEKVFEKQIKTIESQGEKQIKAIQEKKIIENKQSNLMLLLKNKIKKSDSDTENDSLEILRQK